MLERAFGMGASGPPVLGYSVSEMSDYLQTTSLMHVASTYVAMEILVNTMLSSCDGQTEHQPDANDRSFREDLNPLRLLV